ncbi:SUMF1/EgtB/PvdO family nonheme iron enzyme [uncultured Methanomethylovorans sp.]|uniref:formylglycine-generating enzyme family protein n=1 Tax=uncultured Methanomethylovorans sp. TaxID=183759 RepID=UPI002AA620BD|nr:SUMF1/EgtB/PvdO family nonheme iron enzyme [uncultured Methanomethylovorans sp.]
MEPAIKIIRETEFYQGYIRLKMAVTNESPYMIADVILDFIYDDKLLRIDRYEPNYQERRGKLYLGSVDGGKSKSIAIYFDPMMCSKGTDIDCHVTFKDYQGKRSILQMEPKEISVVCPIMKTESDINIGRLKEFINELPSRDNRVCEILRGFDMAKVVNIAREVVEKHDIRHVRTLHTKDENNYELWYYGKTKVTKDDIVIRISVLNAHQTLELFAATQTPETLAGLLAEVGREIKDIVELKISGRNRVVNVSINKSKIDRSNLIDLCDMDGTCDVNIVVDKSEIDRSSIGSVNGNGGDSNQSGSNAGVGNRECPICFNLIDSSNKSLLCKCGSRFCRTCENWFREPCKPGERPLCEACFTAEQERLARENEEKARLKATEENERIRRTEEERRRREDTERKRQEEERLRKEREETAKKAVASIRNSIGMEFVLIHAGEFHMGSNENSYEEPVHKVKISKPFYLSKYLVTQKEWKAVMGTDPSYFKGDNNPVENFSWNDVQEFVKKLNAKEGTNKYRLPSEAEWEYACRAGTTTSYSFGDIESKLRDYAWYDNNSGGNTHPVGQKKPNPWGLYDMHGNVLEWCQDKYHANYKDAPTDGSVWKDGSGSSRISRGGSWFDIASYCRSANRLSRDPDSSSIFLGFRLLRTV